MRDASSAALLGPLPDPTPTGNDSYGASIAVEGEWIAIGYLIASEAELEAFRGAFGP